jgi:hypothetical protein
MCVDLGVYESPSIKSGAYGALIVSFNIAKGVFVFISRSFPKRLNER